MKRLALRHRANAPDPASVALFSVKVLALLAGRKLLLADDSTTIQKIVALTFADEGIEVIAVNNGAEAIEKLEENSPDIVLADVFMPLMNGYQVCEHIKHAEHLKHIPVMLLVGSFEPFDEAEARRVGADDTLTKPFQSIRSLVDRVGALMGRSPATDRVPEVPASAAAPVPTSQLEAETQELPSPELVEPVEEPMTPAELEVVTADTQPLSPEIRQHIESSSSHEDRRVETEREVETMHTSFDTEVRGEASEGFGEALLDLSHVEAGGFQSDDEEILDIDFDYSTPAVTARPAVETAVAVGTTAESSAFAPLRAHTFEDQVHVLAPRDETASHGFQPDEVEFVSAPFEQQPTVDVERPGSNGPEMESSWTVDEAPEVEHSDQVEQVSQPEATSPATNLLSTEEAHVSAPTGLVTLEQLSPDAIDAIARRAVEQLSEKVIQEIAWEVVPQLAELMIKRMLEEREAQNK